MSSSQLPLRAAPLHKNQQLFRDYCLDHPLYLRVPTIHDRG